MRRSDIDCEGGQACVEESHWHCEMLSSDRKGVIKCGKKIMRS